MSADEAVAAPAPELSPPPGEAVPPPPTATPEALRAPVAAPAAPAAAEAAAASALQPGDFLEDSLGEDAAEPPVPCMPAARSALSPKGPGRAPPPVRRGGTPPLEDLSHDVPSELPTLVGASGVATAAATVPALPVAETSRTNTLAEQFMGAPVVVAAIPAHLASGSARRLELARWLASQRRVEAALQALGGTADDAAAAGADADTEAILRVRCCVLLRRLPEAAEVLSRMKAESRSAPLPAELAVLDAQLPFLLEPQASLEAVGRLQALARDWRTAAPGGSSDLRPPLGQRLQLLRALSRAAAAAGHGAVAEAEIRAEIAGAGASADVPRLRSQLGRHLLAVGNRDAASEEFHAAHREHPDSVAALLDSGYHLVSSGNYAGALAQLSAAATAARARLPAGDGDADAALADLLDELVAAENNAAVCRLYTQELREGIRALEAFVRSDPVRFLRPCVAQNLCALYEFTTDPPARRAALRDVATAYQLEDLDPRLFAATA